MSESNSSSFKLVLGMGAEMLQSMADGNLDMVFAGPEADDGKLLWQEPLVWTGTNNLADDADAPIELVLMPAPCSYRQIAFDALTKAGKQWKLTIEANSVQGVQSAIRAGLGISVLPRSTIQDDMPQISDNLPVLPNTSVVSYMKAELTHPYAQRFIDYLLACIDGKFERANEDAQV